MANFRFLFFIFLATHILTAAEQKKLRFFNLDLHISVIADVKNIFESLGHEVTNWSISGHTWVFGKQRDLVDIVNENTWMFLNKGMCNSFYKRYEIFLNQFDAFIVTHNASFALLYENFEKPIIIVNSTRYENPFTDNPEKWAWLNEYLKQGVRKNKIFIVSNNKGDQRYLKHYTGLDSEHIPSLCLYTNSHYRGIRNGFILQSRDDSFKKQLPPFLIRNQDLPRKYEWQDLYDFKGVVHFPYNISTMSLFEQYSANVPLFFPDKNFLRTLRHQQRSEILSELSFFSVKRIPVPSIYGDPNNVNDESVFEFWLNSADFYDEENMPYIQYFESFEHLQHLLQSTDLQKLSDQMREHNAYRKRLIFEKWETLLQKIASS